MPDDDLDRAVDARIDAFRPDVIPAFAGLQRRKRRHDRHRATGAVALAVVALAAVAFVGPSLAGDDRVSDLASGSTMATPTATIRGGPSCDERSLDEPPDSSSDWSNYLRYGERVYTATLDEAGSEVLAGEQLGTVTCKRSGSRTPLDHVLTEGEAAFLTVGTPFYAIQGRSPDDALLAEFEQKRLIFTLDPRSTAALADALRPASDVLVLPAAGLTGARVCKATTIIDLPNENCRRLDRPATARIAAALDGAPPQGTASCFSDEGVLRVGFEGPGARSVPIIVPLACGPIQVGTKTYRLTEVAANTLRAGYEAAPPDSMPADGVVWTGALVCRTESAGSCVQLDADEANALDAVIDKPRRQPVDPNLIVDCVRRPEDFTVTLSAPNVKPIPIIVPSACNPMRVLGSAYEIDQAARDAVRQAYLDN